MCKVKAKLKLHNWNIFQLRKEKEREAFKGKLVVCFVSCYFIYSQFNRHNNTIQHSASPTLATQNY
jgi:hypothetical protein